GLISKLFLNMEGEVAELKNNADNLAQCLHALLQRIEQLEGSATLSKVDAPVYKVHQSSSPPTRSVNDAIDGLLKSNHKGKRESSVDEPDSDVQVVCNETISVDPETGLKKRTVVTERVLTTKTFHAIAVDGEPLVNGHLLAPAYEARLVTLKRHPFNEIEFDRLCGQIVVTRVRPDSELSKDIHAGDTIVEVNGQPVSEIGNLAAFDGGVSLKLVPTPLYQAPSVFYRVLTEYNADNDDNLPQKWAGLNVKKGEIIQVISKDDNWMQARKVNDISRVGLVPANQTIERVGMLTPYGRRVLVLLGVPGVGRRTIKSMLLSHLPQYFATVAPYTSRAAKAGEQEGREYHFRTKDELLQKIRSGDMIEWGELDNQVYGTSAETVRACVRGGRVCVLDCAPQALNYLYNGEFMPFVVVIAPPELDELRQINLLRSNRRSEEQMKATIEENKKLLSSDYARMFHLIITNRNADVTFKRLMDALNDLKNEIQWVPESWLR
uniref:Guanylate kinase-like domain-containing protein n=2 Tax=Parascaris univalens TaxID=6257 RepID=A0A915C345_PARUN